MKYLTLFLMLLVCVSSANAVCATPESVEKPALLSGDDIVDKAMEYEGVNYRRGGASPTAGFDCSGFVYYIFGLFGAKMARSSRQQYKKELKVEDYRELEKGDLVFFSGSRRSSSIGHVGIVTAVNPETGSFSFVHAATDGIRVSSSEEPYYSRRLLCACKSPRYEGGSDMALSHTGAPNQVDR